MKFKRPSIRVAQHVHSLLIPLLLVLFTHGQTSAEGPQELYATYDSVKHTGKLRNPSMPFTLEVRCVPLKKGGPSSKPVPAYFGPDGFDPWCVVDKIALSIKGKNVLFPRESYEDLADVNVAFDVHIKNRPGVVTLEIRGGDGAGSYKTRFFIHDHRVTVREIEDMNEQGELRVLKKTL